jgi:hypothetical protein
MVTARTPPTFRAFVAKELKVTLTPAQNALAAVAIDGAPVPAGFEDLFALPAGTVVPKAQRRTLAWLCGRGSGKSLLSAYYVLWRVLYGDCSRLAKGELGFGVIFSPTIELSGQILRFARGALTGTRYERGIVADGKESFDIKRPDGKHVRFAALAARPGGMTGRGKTLLAAVLEECCFFAPESKGIINDEHVYKALPARLTEDGQILLISTPWAQEGLLFKLWEKQFGKPSTALVAVAPTERMRPDDDTRERLAAIRELDPDNAARELDCEWLPVGAGNAYLVEDLRRAVFDGVESPPQPLQRIACGGDIAQVKDRTAFVAVREERGILEVVDALEIRPPRHGGLAMRDIVAAAEDFVTRNHATPTIRVDHHNLTNAQDAAKEAGARVKFEPCSESQADRQQRFFGLRVLLTDGRLRIPRRLAWLTEQLAKITAAPLPGGGFRFGVARTGGSHADAASALLLAVEELLDAQMPSAQQWQEAAPFLCGELTDTTTSVFQRLELDHSAAESELEAAIEYAKRWESSRVPA